MQLTLGCFDADFLEPLGFLHGPYDGFHQLLNLLVQASNIRVLLCWLLIHFHGLHSAVILGRQCIEDEIGIFVHANEITRLELLVVY